MIKQVGTLKRPIPIPDAHPATSREYLHTEKLNAMPRWVAICSLRALPPPGLGLEVALIYLNLGPRRLGKSRQAPYSIIQ